MQGAFQCGLLSLNTLGEKAMAMPQQGVYLQEINHDGRNWLEGFLSYARFAC